MIAVIPLDSLLSGVCQIKLGPYLKPVLAPYVNVGPSRVRICYVYTGKLNGAM